MVWCCSQGLVRNVSVWHVVVRRGKVWQSWSCSVSYVVDGFGVVGSGTAVKVGLGAARSGEGCSVRSGLAVGVRLGAFWIGMLCRGASCW